MPTGYTAAVADGEIEDFADFAMQCARAFGACITMRDDPSDTPIPDEFTPSDYNAKALLDAQSELRRLEKMTEEEKVAASAADFKARLQSWQDHEDDKSLRKQRYEAMLAKVLEWVPPTDEHIDMKAFMVSQLEDSIKHDCGPSYSKKPLHLTPDDWFADALARANREVAYHAKAQAEEIERARNRTRWISALRSSLKPMPAKVA